jgi:predicted acetyltransferase
MPVELTSVDPAHSIVLGNLRQLYRHDLSEFRNSFPNSEGRFTVMRFEASYGNDDSSTLLFDRAGIPVGFAIVNGLSGELRRIGEFFVIRSVRGSGVGYDAAMKVLRRFPGRWQVAFQEENPVAARFWRRVATGIAPNRWTEERRQDPERDFIPPDIWISLNVSA